MQTRQLGNSDLNITPVGYGAWAIGGAGWQFGWGSQDDSDSVGAIHAALDAGVNWIDTAAVYGLGHSEEIVARALKGRSARPYVFTKCSLLGDERGNVVNNLKAASIRQEVEASLRRLKTDVIDLYQIHWPNPDADIEEGWTAMAQLRAEGKVRYIGVSNFNVEQMRRAQAIASITSLQPPYSLIHREVEADILPYCRHNGIGVIAYSPMASGLLTGAMTRERAANLPEDDWRKRNAEFNEPRLSKNLELVEVLHDIGRRQGRSPGEVAIAWVLANPVVTGAIVGARTAQQAEEVMRAGSFRLTPLELAQIEATSSSEEDLRSAVAAGVRQR
jgi:aryl-alcohol dehydrogenase-like predicted oxidoreductase